eukprot:6996324-Pyramimonas_sp.AAC.1
MINADGQRAVRADEDAVENMPLTRQHPFRSDGYPAEWIIQQHLISVEEARGYMNAFISMARDQW